MPARHSIGARVWRTVAANWLLLLVVAALTASPAGAFPAKHPSKAEVRAFRGFVHQLKRDTGYCTAAASDTQIYLGEVIAAKTTASESTLVKLDTASRKAQTACDDTKDGTLVKLATLGAPGRISWLHVLKTLTLLVEYWCSTDTTHVLHDIQNLAETSGNATADITQLKNDITAANGDASTIKRDLSHAAHRLRIKKFTGIGLVVW